MTAINLKCEFFNAFCCYTIRLEFITVICIIFGCKTQNLAKSPQIKYSVKLTSD